ncbi:MAG: hypothetical protein AAFR96_00195 [Planctomycetota bacterium]
MNKPAFRIAASLAMLFQPAATAAAQASAEPAKAATLPADAVLMSWTVGETETIELLRENNMLVLARTPADGETARERLRLIADAGRVVYMPLEAGDGRFYIVNADGSLEFHGPDGKIEGGPAPQLVSVADDQRAMLDSFKPADAEAAGGPASWSDVIESLNKSRDGGGGAPGAAGGTEAEAVDPNRLDIKEMEDGTRLINDRFLIAGDGSKESPYQITWDYLTSARTTYAPRQGRTDIPAHIKMLEDQYVRIGGYLQFPLASREPKELLVMLNQWDGCCIGVPPTPYDAIEVSLTNPATQGEKFAVEGALVGKLTVDPYLVGDWLIGLYLLGEASLDVSGSRSADEVYGNSPTVGHPDAMPGHQSR